MLERVRLLSLLALVLIVRFALFPLDLHLGEGPWYSFSLQSPFLGLVLLYYLEYRQDRNHDFEIEEYLEGVAVVVFGAMPLAATIPAIMLTALIAGWASHISGKTVG